jgi:hypothetical protein
MESIVRDTASKGPVHVVMLSAGPRMPLLALVALAAFAFGAVFGSIAAPPPPEPVSIASPSSCPRAPLGMPPLLRPPYADPDATE